MFVNNKAQKFQLLIAVAFENTFNYAISRPFTIYFRKKIFIAFLKPQLWSTLCNNQRPQTTILENLLHKTPCRRKISTQFSFSYALGVLCLTNLFKWLTISWKLPFFSARLHTAAFMPAFIMAFKHSLIHLFTCAIVVWSLSLRFLHWIATKVTVTSLQQVQQHFFFSCQCRMSSATPSCLCIVKLSLL